MQGNRKGYRFLSAIFALLFTVLVVTPVLADELEEKQQQLIRQQNEQIKALLNALQLTTKVVGSLPQPAGREEDAQ